MMRTLVFFVLGLITLSTLVAPGLALVGMLMLLFLFATAVWGTAFAVTSRGEPGEALAHTKRHRFLGPGGPDDPFADVPYDDEG